MNIHIERLSHTFDRSAYPVAALANLSLDVSAGEFVAIIGESGCGKSTLLRLIGNLLQPSQGTIRLDGAPPAHMTAHKRIAWMAQQVALLPWRTVRANIMLAQRINPQHDRPFKSVDDLLALVGLREFADAYPFTLSGGMQQRVALARTLALGADLWLMDEPFAALDELTRERLTVDVLRYWQDTRPTILWVTHHIPEAVRLADRVLVMTSRPGKFCADIPVTLTRPHDDSTPEFQAVVRHLRTIISAAREPINEA